jgi:hypothetical protein
MDMKYVSQLIASRRAPVGPKDADEDEEAEAGDAEASAQPEEGAEERLRNTVKRNREETRVDTMPPIMQIESLNCFLPRIPR